MGNFGIELEDIIGQKSPEKVAKEMLERLRLRRKEHGYSRAKLAALSGVKEPTIRHAEKTGKISLIHLLYLASALDCLDEFEVLFANTYYHDIEDIIISNAKRK